MSWPHSSGLRNRHVHYGTQELQWAALRGACMAPLGPDAPARPTHRLCTRPYHGQCDKQLRQHHVCPHAEVHLPSKTHTPRTANTHAPPTMASVISSSAVTTCPPWPGCRTPPLKMALSCSSLGGLTDRPAGITAPLRLTCAPSGARRSRAKCIKELSKSAGGGGLGCPCPLRRCVEDFSQGPSKRSSRGDGRQ